MQHMKPAIIDLIEQGYGNAEIVKAVKCSNRYACHTRSEYNKLVKDRKRSLHSEPKHGTKSRLAYDYLVANPKATTVEVQKATGVDRGTCSVVRSRYILGTKPPRRVTSFSLNQVHLGELELVE